MSYPECAVVPGGDRDQVAWLFVFAATPSAVRLCPDLTRFLREALADLPALATTRAITVRSTSLVHVDSAKVAAVG
jgi:hypothetical protein